MALWCWYSQACWHIFKKSCFHSSETNCPWKHVSWEHLLRCLVVPLCIWRPNPIMGLHPMQSGHQHSNVENCLVCAAPSRQEPSEKKRKKKKKKTYQNSTPPCLGLAMEQTVSLDGQKQKPSFWRKEKAQTHLQDPGCMDAYIQAFCQINLGWHWRGRSPSPILTLAMRRNVQLNDWAVGINLQLSYVDLGYGSLTIIFL